MNTRSLFIPLSLLFIATQILHAQRVAPKRHTNTPNATEVTSQHLEIATGSQGVKAVGTAEAKNEIVEHLKHGIILDYATFLVAIVTVIFAVFIAVVGSIEWQRFKHLRNDLATQWKELALQSKELKKERRSLGDQIEAFKSEIHTQENQLAASQRFIEAVLSHHSVLLVGIVEAFGAALKPEEARKLTSLIFEAEAALDLFYPNKSEVYKALRRLEEVGLDGSVPSLAQLRDDESADCEIRLRAAQVLTKVKDRLKHARQPT